MKIFLIVYYIIIILKLNKFISVMEAHPCEKESFLDKAWRYVNEIVSRIKLFEVIFLCNYIGFQSLKASRQYGIL